MCVNLVSNVPNTPLENRLHIENYKIWAIRIDQL